MCGVSRTFVRFIAANAVLVAAAQQPAVSQAFGPAPDNSVSPSATQLLGAIGSRQAGLPGSLKRTQLLGSSPKPFMPMPLVAPLFVEDETTHSEITFVSDSTKPLEVDVVLSALSGAMIASKSLKSTHIARGR